MRVLLLASLAAMAGCYEPKFSGCDITCAPDDACPGDGTCVNGKCRFTGDMCDGQPLSGLAEITTGGRHACARTAEGALFCWGDDSRGQVDGTLGQAIANPKAISTPSVDSWVHVDAGGEHTCAIGTENGVAAVFCWGDNSFKQGGRVLDDVLAPSKVEGVVDPIRITTGDHHSCAVTNDKQILCWGNNSLGQLGSTAGLGDASAAATPVADSDWIDVSAGGDSTCGIKADHTVWCWGDNGNGKLGDGVADGNMHPDPTQVMGSFGTTNPPILSVGTDTVCAVEANTLSCWGDNVVAAAGRDPNPPGIGQVLTPMVTEGASNAIGRVAMGHDFGCAISSVDGHVLCWGFDDVRLGDNRDHDRSAFGPLTERPVVLAGDGDPGVAFALDAGGRRFINDDGFACALFGDPQTGGTARCWGSNDHGQLGDGTMSIVHTPTAVLGGKSWVALRMKGHTACAVEDFNPGASGTQAFGPVYCWGDNQQGIVAPTVATPFFTEPTAVTESSDAFAVAVGSHHACSLSKNGMVFSASCWGRNTNNALGITGNATKSDLSFAMTPYFGIGSSDEATCVFNGESTGALCWGRALWIGGAPLTTPVAVGNPTVHGPLGMGKDTVYSLFNLGVVSRGDDTKGVLGNGDPSAGEPGPTTETSVVTNTVGSSKLMDIVGVAEADPSARHQCVVGDVDTFCWGDNSKGQLGSSVSDSTFARPIRAGNPFVARVATDFTQEQSIAVGGEFSCAILSADPQILCWGDNDLSQCTDNGQNNNGVPTTISDAGSNTMRFKSVAAGAATACGIGNDKQIYCWGSSRLGETGTGGADRNFAVDVMSP